MLDWIALDKIVGLPGNPKDHALDDIVASLQEFGFAGVILVNPNTGNLIAGHGRVDGLRWLKSKGKKAPLGIKVQDNQWFVPVWYQPVKSGKEMALAVSLNRLVETGGWNEDLLARALADIAADGGLEGTGFDEDDLDRLIENLGTESFKDNDNLFSETHSEQNGYQIVVYCDSPAEQHMVLSLLKSQGYRCQTR